MTEKLPIGTKVIVIDKGMYSLRNDELEGEVVGHNGMLYAILLPVYDARVKAVMVPDFDTTLFFYRDQLEVIHD